MPAGLLKNCWHSWQDTVLRYFYGGVFSFLPPKFLLYYWFDTSNDFLTYWRPFLPENWAVNWRIPWIISRRHLWLTRYFQDDFYYNFWLCLNSILNPWWITLFKAFHDQLIRKICDSTDFLNSFLNQTSQNQIGDTISIFGSVRGVEGQLLGL